MEPMTPMKPMEPMQPTAPWWPDELGSPSTTGSQNGLRYAVFADRQRLLVERDGRITTYDTGTHRIGGVSQQNGSLAFTSQDGPVALDSLREVD